VVWNVTGIPVRNRLSAPYYPQAGKQKDRREGDLCILDFGVDQAARAGTGDNAGLNVPNAQRRTKPNMLADAASDIH
jgi:hypothetical protein